MSEYDKTKRKLNKIWNKNETNLDNLNTISQPQKFYNQKFLSSIISKIIYDSGWLIGITEIGDYNVVQNRFCLQTLELEHKMEISIPDFLLPFVKINIIFDDCRNINILGMGSNSHQEISNIAYDPYDYFAPPVYSYAKLSYEYEPYQFKMIYKIDSKYDEIYLFSIQYRYIIECIASKLYDSYIIIYPGHPSRTVNYYQAPEINIKYKVVCTIENPMYYNRNEEYKSI